MEEEAEDDPHGHITSLAVKRSHRRSGIYISGAVGNVISGPFMKLFKRRGKKGGTKKMEKEGKKRGKGEREKKR